MAVITISRQFGSGGAEISERVAKALGYEHVDKELIAHVAQEAQVSEEEVEKYDEAALSPIERFLHSLFGGSEHLSWSPGLFGEVPAPFPPLPEREAGAPHILDHQECLRLTQQVLKKLYERGNVVVIGRAGMMVLKDKPDVFHVRIIAPLEWRVQQVMRLFGCSASEAKARIDAEDRRRADYIKQFYKVDWNNPELYHLVVNTAKTGVDGAVKIIVEAVNA